MNPLVYVCAQVGLLKDVLEAWRREVDKKPASMTAEQAFAALGLEPGQDEAAVRKAYYRLAQQYHPDKNPDGRVSAPRCYCAVNHYFRCRLVTCTWEFMNISWLLKLNIQWVRSLHNIFLS